MTSKTFDSGKFVNSNRSPMKYLFVAFISSTLISQSLMDALAILVFFGMFYQFITNQKNNIAASPGPISFLCGLEWLWPIWILIIALGIGFGPGGWHELARVLEWKWVFAFYGIYWAWQKYPLHRVSWNWIWVILFIGSIYGIESWYLSYDLIHHTSPTDFDRVGGFFMDPMTFAHVYGQFFCFGVGILFVRFKESGSDIANKEALLIMACIATGLALLFSFTRGVWISTSIGILIMAFVVNKKWGLASLGLFIFGFLILFFSWHQFHERILFAFNFTNNYDSERVALWKANWEMFKDHPLLGIGYGEYKSILRIYFDKLGFPSNQFMGHAHNQFLHTLSGTGVLGSACYLTFIGTGFFRTLSLLRQSRTSPNFAIAVGVLGSQICFLISGLTESNFERAKVRLTYLTLIALIFALTKKEKTQEPPQ